MGLIYGPMTLGLLAGITVVLRIVARTRNGMQDFGWDDGTIVMAYSLGIPFNVFGIVCKHQQ